MGKNKKYRDEDFDNQYRQGLLNSMGNKIKDLSAQRSERSSLLSGVIGTIISVIPSMVK